MAGGNRGNDDIHDLAKDNSRWNTDDDGAICKLKKDGKSWVDIGASINRPAELVKERFKFIKSEIEAVGCDTDSIGENWAVDMRKQGKVIPSPDKPSPSRVLPTNYASPMQASPPIQASSLSNASFRSKQSSSPKQDLRPKQSSSLRRPPQEHSPAKIPPVIRKPPEALDVTAIDDRIQEVDAVKQPVHARGGGGREQHKSSNKNTSTSPKTGNIKLSGKIISRDGVRFAEIADPSSSSSDTEKSDSEEEDEFDYEAEREEQKRFLCHEYWSEMYPAQKTYQADYHWNERDCKVLAVIEAKDEALKYKRIQADFFNVTGRMISEEIIKHKMTQYK